MEKIKSSEMRSTKLNCGSYETKLLKLEQVKSGTLTRSSSLVLTLKKYGSTYREYNTKGTPEPERDNIMFKTKLISPCSRCGSGYFEGKKLCPIQQHRFQGVN